MITFYATPNIKLINVISSSVVLVCFSLTLAYHTIASIPLIVEHAGLKSLNPSMLSTILLSYDDSFGRVPSEFCLSSYLSVGKYEIISIIDEGVKKDNQELIEEGIELVKTTLDRFYS